MVLRRAQRTAAGTGLQPSSRAEAARIAWGGGRDTLAGSAVREQARSKTGIASLPHVKLSPMSAPGPAGERQEHLDASVSLAGAGLEETLVSRP